jgi:hypothetical protein
LKRPEGTFFFDYYSDELFDPTNPGGILFEMTSGKHHYRVDRDQSFQLNFFHSSPGTGTRVASIDLHEVSPSKPVRIVFAWCPDETQLVVGPTRNATGPVVAKGRISPKEFRVGENGAVHQIGDMGVEVASVYVNFGEHAILEPTAIGSWQDTLTALEYLRTGTSPIGYVYELVICNLTLSVLATGFETYAKKRFVELIHEGIEPDFDSLVDSILGSKAASNQLKTELVSEARGCGRTPTEVFVREGKINFLNYKKCKLAYNKAFGIKFGEISLKGATFADMQRYLGYRHRVVHISPLLGCLNLEKTPAEQPVLPGRELAQSAVDCFSEFVGALHKATLGLRP